MWPLLACSFLALVVILERTMFWLGAFWQRSRDLPGEVLGLAARGQWERIRQRTEGSRNYVIRVLISGILHRNFTWARPWRPKPSSRSGRCGRFMGVLDTMITVSPLLGIFGTVLGIITSFKVLGMSGLQDPRAVTGGIAQALITTAAGLGIAIISVFPYNYFNSRIDHACHEMEKYATGLELAYERVVAENGKIGRDAA